MNPRKRANGAIDERDLEILAALEEDARIPWRQLARRLGVSETTVYLRIKKLTEQGVLKGFSAKINPQALGLRYLAFLMLKVKAPAFNKVRNTLIGKNFIARIYEITGQYNFLVEVAAPSQEDVLKIIDEIAEIGGVEEVLVLSVLRKLWETDGVIRGLLGFTPRGTSL